MHTFIIPLGTVITWESGNSGVARQKTGIVRAWLPRYEKTEMTAIHPHIDRVKAEFPEATSQEQRYGEILEPNNVNRYLIEIEKWSEKREGKKLKSEWFTPYAKFLEDVWYDAIDRDEPFELHESYRTESEQVTKELQTA